MRDTLTQCEWNQASQQLQPRVLMPLLRFANELGAC
jgi:hypothetical protein